MQNRDNGCSFGKKPGRAICRHWTRKKKTMKILRTIRNYCCSCGIENEEFKQVKKSAYISNFEVWRILHILMDASFGALFLYSMFSDYVGINRWFYLGALVYSCIATVFFFVLKKESIAGQLLVYLSVSVLFLFGAFITQNKPGSPSISFIAFLLIAPIFVIDRPFFMAIELTAASSIFLTWMYFVKDPDIWRVDLMNTIIFTFIGIFIHIITASIRIKEFVLIRKINIQKDIDELTGLKNKAALTRAINKYVRDEPNGKGLFFVLDIDYFKSINDTYGHDVGDVILNELGTFLKERFTNGEIVGRFGGDEFIIFIKGNDETEYAEGIAKDITSGANERIKIPNGEGLSISVGVAEYHGEEKNYSEIFKKADIALYKTKANRKIKYSISK